MCDHPRGGEVAPFRTVCHLLAPQTGRGQQLWEALVPSEAQGQPFRWGLGWADSREDWPLK